MAGRAGRAGLDEKGDSIVILHPGKEVELVCITNIAIFPNT